VKPATHVVFLTRGHYPVSVHWQGGQATSVVENTIPNLQTENGENKHDEA
jgi:hypothetical protein